MRINDRIQRTVEQLDPRILTVDITVQQALNERRVKEISEAFDPTYLGAITVSRRSDGTHIVLDGQHRLAGARSNGYTQPVTAVVYEGLTLPEEASLFLNLNNTKQVSAQAKFRVRVVEGDKAANAIYDVLRRFGWELGSNAAHTFNAVQALEKVYNGAGVDKAGQREDLVDSVMSVITHAWDGDEKSAHGVVVSGLGQLFARHGNEIDQDALSERLAKIRPAKLLAKARSLRDARGGAVSAAMAEVLVGEYNTRRTTRRLPDWRWAY